MRERKENCIKGHQGPRLQLQSNAEPPKTKKKKHWSLEENGLFGKHEFAAKTGEESEKLSNEIRAPKQHKPAGAGAK